MKPMQIVAGVLAGVAGAVIWAAISHFANMEIGYVAWGIGGLVGGVVAAAGENGLPAAILAVVITALSILAGKYAAVDMAVKKAADEIAAESHVTLADVGDDDLQGILARDIAAAKEAAGEEIEWPPGADNFENDVPVEQTYPRDIWKTAGKQLAKKTPQEQSQMKDEYVKEAEEFQQAVIEGFGGMMRKEAFKQSFGIFDLVFFGLAVATAWGIASRDEG